MVAGTVLCVLVRVLLLLSSSCDVSLRAMMHPPAVVCWPVHSPISVVLLLLLLLLLLQAAHFDKVQAQTKQLVEAGPVPGIQSFCVYSEHLSDTAVTLCKLIVASSCCSAFNDVLPTVKKQHTKALAAAVTLLQCSMQANNHMYFGHHPNKQLDTQAGSTPMPKCSGQGARQV
jgi:hypothetical protein